MVRVQPQRVRALARAEGLLAKTDRLDARLLARFGERIRPPADAAADPQQQEMSDLLARRTQLLQMRTAERNRLGTAGPAVRKHIQEHLAWLDKALAEIEHDLEDRMNSSADLPRQQKLLQSVPGIGKITAQTLLIRLPELQSKDRKAIACFVGKRSGGAPGQPKRPQRQATPHPRRKTGCTQCLVYGNLVGHPL